MNDTALTALMHNAGLLLAMVVVFDMVTSRQRLANNPFHLMLAGLILGGLGIGVILASFQLEPGIVFDTRSVLLGISGLFLGTIPTLIAMAMTAAFRLWQGGTAAWAGAAVILASGCLGIAWRHSRRRPLTEISWGELYTFGVVVHVVMLALMLTLPWENAKRVLSAIGLPVLLVYPLATTALGFLLANRLRREHAIVTLAESEERFRSLFESSLDGFLITTPDGHVLSANPATCRMLGRTEGEIIQAGRGNIVDPHDQRLAGLLEQRVRTGRASGELTLIRGDGSRFEAEISTAVFHTSTGPRTSMVIRDITERKRAEAALQESEERLRLATDAARVGIWERNLKTNRLQWSPMAEQLNGYEPGSFPGTEEAFLELLHPDSRADYATARRRVREGDGLLHTELRFRLHDGRERWGMVHGRLIRDEHGQPTRVVGIDKDITERKLAEIRLQETLAKLETSHQVLLRAIEDRKNAEAQVRQMNAELEQRVSDRTAQLQAANHELEAFSYSVSHDLRAPLRAINGYARILAEDHGPKLDAEGQRVLGVIRDEALRMGELIDDLLQLSRLGRQSLNIAPTDMTGLAREVYERLSATAPSRPVDFRLSPLPDAPADAALLRQVWVNLLDNALKYTRQRSPAVIEVAGAIHGNEAVYSVKDNGAGFEMKYADKLFGVFQRLHNTAEFEGTGVGLAMVQRLIHRHGGRVWAEGQLDCGATFHFALPLKAGAGPDSSNGSAAIETLQPEMSL